MKTMCIILTVEGTVLTNSQGFLETLSPSGCESVVVNGLIDFSLGAAK